MRWVIDLGKIYIEERSEEVSMQNKVTEHYDLGEVVKSYRWLGHEGGYTELNAYHKEYKPGQENKEHNTKNKLYPKIWYARDSSEVVRFVELYHPDRMLCYGLNPRPQAFKTPSGYTRSATEQEIEYAQNLLTDIDLLPKEPTAAHFDALRSFLRYTDPFFQDLGLEVPRRAYSGHGYHLLSPFPPIAAGEVPDISKRLARFQDEFRIAFKEELDALEARVDSTADLRRMVKIYGTRKPDADVPLSRLYATRRKEDPSLRQYLLDMTGLNSSSGAGTQPPAAFGGELPARFLELLGKDKVTRALWEGRGKARGDTSASGYDASLAWRLAGIGYTDLGDIGTIVKLRPNGSYQKGRKGEDYLARTARNAVTKPKGTPAQEEVAKEVLTGFRAFLDKKYPDEGQQ